MADFKVEVPMLSETHAHSSDDSVDSRCHQRFKSKVRSASLSFPTNSVEFDDSQSSLVTHTGPFRNERKIPIKQMSGPLYISYRPESLQQSVDLEAAEPKTEKCPSFNGIDQKEWPNDNYGDRNEHLLRSGQLGMCSDPYCTSCSTYYKAVQHNNYKASGIFDSKFRNVLYGDGKGWARKFFSDSRSYVPGIMNPHAKFIQQWNQFFVISCLIAVFVDPLFFFLLSVQKDNKCIVINWPLTIAFALFRSMTDFVYFLHMLLQFRLAYAAPKSRLVGAGELVDHPKKIALHYLSTYFLLDLFVVLPLPQIMLLVVLPKGNARADYVKSLPSTSVLVQYIPRLFRSLSLLVGQSPISSNFQIRILLFALFGHVVGSCWYHFGLQRVNECLQHACRDVHMFKFIDCGHGDDLGEFEADPRWLNWINNTEATACFNNGFPYGIYAQAVKLTAEGSIVTRYVYSLFWGFQQISTLAGNQIPSYSVLEVLFTMAILGVGLFFLSIFIGDMQNLSQALWQRKLEMTTRCQDVEQWMSHRRLPEELRRQVRQAERYSWAATRGVNEEMLLENLPEDLQRDIRRHLFKFVKKVRIFALMDEPILDAICERLRQKTYISGSKILSLGCLVDKMVFVVRGELESIGEDGISLPLREGDVCGEELLTWCLEHSSINKDVKKIRIPGQRLLSNMMVRCVTNVEAFTLKAADLEEVTSLFSRFLKNDRLQGAIRYESLYWRSMAARRIQVAWRYRKKRLIRANTSNTQNSSEAFVAGFTG